MVHLPKCGGTSIRVAIHDGLTRGGVELPVGRHGSAPELVWGGQISTSPKDLAEGPRRVAVVCHNPLPLWRRSRFHVATLVRHPVLRAHSFYTYALWREIRLSEAARDAADFDDFVERHADEPELSNAMTKILAGLPHTAHLNENLRRWIEPPLEKVQLVGVLPRIQAFWRCLQPLVQARAAQVGVPYTPGPCPHENISGGPKPKRLDAIDPATRRRIEDANDADMALYEQAERIAP